MKQYLVIGATSAIARACCRQLLTAHARGDGEPIDFFLAGRSSEKLEQMGADLQARGAREVYSHPIDLADTTAHSHLLEAIDRSLSQIDVALLAHGTLPDQAACERDADLAVSEFNLNGTSTLSVLTRLAYQMEQRGQGTLVVITSVAGDRGRPSNYVYGSAKAAVSVFCEGLRARLYASGVHVMDVRPGFVDTPMTQDLELPSLLLASPDGVARRILRGIARRRDVLYVPAFWALIMAIIRFVPRFVFKRLSL